MNTIHIQRTDQMLKRKSGSRNRRSFHRTNKRNATIIGGGLLVVLLIAALFFNRVMKLYPDIIERSNKQTENDSIVHEDDDLDSRISNPSHVNSEFDLAVIGKFESLIEHSKYIKSATSIPSGYVIPGLDLSGDGRSATLIAMNTSGVIEPSRSLRRNGFQRTASEIILRSDDIVLLHIDAFNMKNRDGNPIIDQTPAPYGYAYKTSSIESDEIPFDSPVSLIHIILIDQHGNGVSDELTLYWHPVTNKFHATNTFGAPGTY
jgi:hypothetical protein